MKIKIDGKWVTVTDECKNIVDVARMNNISIHAPCYLSNRKYGCCNSCHIIVNNEPKYACVTKPENLMVVDINTDELIKKRKTSIELYVNAINNNEILECDCNCDEDESNESCGCGNCIC